MFQVNLYALQCLLRMLPHLETSLDVVLTPFTEQLIPNLASQRANIVTLTSQILDGFRVHVGKDQAHEKLMIVQRDHVMEHVMDHRLFSNHHSPFCR